MKYAKPEVKVLNNALEAVRGNRKPSTVALDNQMRQLRNATISAYEADE